MTASTLDPDNLPESDRQLGKGHGTNALGPSDISDSGSDVQGGLKTIEESVLGLDRGTNEDADSHTIEASEDTDDSTGTGESSTAGRNADVEIAADINIDRIDGLNPDDEAGLDLADEREPPPTRRADIRQQHKR